MLKLFAVLCVLSTFSAVLVQSNEVTSERGCTIPPVIQGQWFSWENEKSTLTTISATKIFERGFCVKMSKNHDEYTFIHKKQAENCYQCSRIIVRTPNVIEKLEGPCFTLSPGTEPTIENVCYELPEDQQLVTLFNENYVPVNCRLSFEGVYQFSYESRFRFNGVCNNTKARMKSCPKAGSKFLIQNQRFDIFYEKCNHIDGTFTGWLENSCLGDWFVGENHYFAAANTKESRRYEKFRCYVKHRDDDLHIGVSVTAECNTLKTVETAPETLGLIPVKAEYIEPGCTLPQNFTGKWVTTDNIDADVVISAAHINETYRGHSPRYRHISYVCRERRGNKVVMERVTIDGCQTDYVCFDFSPRHHNIIRYRKGLALVTDDFNIVCSEEQFMYLEAGKYDLFLAKDPVPMRCPVAGNFNFTQKGEQPFQDRSFDGVSLGSDLAYYCKQNISQLSVCDTNQKELTIDVNYCLPVDYLSRPIDLKSDPDHRLNCIAYWKENNRSLLITYDEFDPFYKYRCWVYQRDDINRVLLSQAVGAFCKPEQTATSWNHTEGAAVAIDAIEYENQYYDCPLFFDEGEYPWKYLDGFNVTDESEAKKVQQSNSTVSSDDHSVDLHNGTNVVPPT